LLLRDSVEISGTHWISGIDPHTHWVYAAKTRYRQEDAPCSLGWIRNRGALVEFAEPQWATTPGAVRCRVRIEGLSGAGV
jgi:tRNA-specific 2-thiouridylase